MRQADLNLQPTVLFQQCVLSNCAAGPHYFFHMHCIQVYFVILCTFAIIVTINYMVLISIKLCLCTCMYIFSILFLTQFFFTGPGELGNMTSSLIMAYTIVPVAGHPYINLLPNLTLAVVGRHSLRDSLVP